MSLFLNKIKGKQVLQVCRVLNNLQTKQCHWLPTLKPGPYPKTEEERIAAAKKYNLLPEEYEPYPDDGRGAGDYPKLPYEAVDEKDQYYNWDHRVLSRNFMDPLPREVMLLLPYADAPSKWEETRRGAKIFSTFVGVVLFSMYILYQFKLVKPLSEKQFIGKGEVHYSFEIVDELDEEDILGEEEEEEEEEEECACVCSEEEET